MTLLELSENQLRHVGSLKWTGMRGDDDHETIGAWIAEMDFGTAQPIKDRLKRALDEGLLGYLPQWAPLNAAQALSAFHERRHGWHFEPSDVRAAGSVLEALEATITRLTRPGSSVVVPTPAYMPFLTLPMSLGRRVIEVPSLHQPSSGPAEAWSLNLQGIEGALRAGAGLVILCNPWNPTGRVLTPSEMTELNHVVSKYDALIFSDEIHSPLTHRPREYTSYASLGPEFAAHTVTAMAAAKGWNIAGLPAAQVVLPDPCLRKLWDLQTPGFVGRPTTFGAIAAITAYEEGEEWLNEAIEYVGRNLRYLEQALAGTRIDYTPPQGSYVAWLGWEDYRLPRCPASILRNEAHVAVNCGEDMGEGYRDWIRVNAAMPHELWKETIERILTVEKRYS